MNGDLRAGLILFAAAFLILATGSFWGLPPGKAVVGGLVILDGGVPYRDFWSMYAPGQFYAVAGLFWLFGRELLVQAVAVAVVRAASAVAFFVLLRRLQATRTLALCLSAIFALMFWTTGPELTDYPPALLCLLLALDRMVRYYSEGGEGHLRWAGVWVGVAAWFKHDVAAYVAFGIALSVFVSWLAARQRRPAVWQAPARATLTVAASALAAFTPLAAWTALTAGAAAWNDLVVFPATVFHKVRGERYPPLLPDWEPLSRWISNLTDVRSAFAAADYFSGWVVLNAPQMMFLVGVGVVLAARRRLEPARLAQLSLFLSCLPFFWSAAHIQHNTHPYSMASLSAGVGVVLWSQLGDRRRWQQLLRRPLVVAVAIYAGGLLTTAAIDGARVYYEWRGSRVLDLPGFRGIRVPGGVYESFQPIGQFFRDHTQEGEPVYTGLLRHDAIVINNPVLYAITGRPACCGYTELHPGVADRAEVQSEIIKRLESRGVRAIALWAFGWSEQEMQARKARNMAAVADAGSTLLDRYIAEHFRVIESYGEYHVLWRRDVPFPTTPGETRELPVP